MARVRMILPDDAKREDPLTDLRRDLVGGTRIEIVHLDPHVHVARVKIG
ncbi:hypothetical protein SAMN05518849_11213 [Sphingobium sp. AP50]|nr:hypothetical protein SAMN05518849_11213 [Sphingobium sp. AP50]